MTLLDQFIWIIFPYIMLTMFVVGHIYRYNTDQKGWSAKSSEFLENKSLKWGSLLFHIGILLVLGGHIFGLLVPKWMTEKVGITEELYHLTAIAIGGFAGVITLLGIAILLFRRTNNKRIRITSSPTDMLISILIFLEVSLGVYNTLGHNLLIGGFDYRETIAPWLRGLLIFQPDATLMKEVPIVFQLHTLLAFTIFGLWPFTRLVHVWSLPLEYLKRSYIIYRSRNAQKSIQLRQMK